MPKPPARKPAKSPQFDSIPDVIKDIRAGKMVIVTDDTQVRAGLRQPADESLLQRVHVLVLVDDHIADVVADVLLDGGGALIFVGAAFQELYREVDHLGEVEVGISVQQLHVVVE